MDEPLDTAFGNRDDPIPVLRVPLVADEQPQVAADKGRSPGKREALRNQANNLKDKLRDARQEYTGAGIQDRLLNALLAQVVPPEVEGDGECTEAKERPPKTFVDKPGFSLPTMTYNFRRFNARIGIVFVFQTRMIRLFAWDQPTHTLSFLALYTLICLQPHLLPIAPLAMILFFVMISSFLTRHPPPPAPQESSSTDAAAFERYASYGYSYRPVAPAQRVKPAPEMSKDFFRNMRDLQNSMEDFSRVHDGAVALISPYTDFSDEKLSSAVFLSILALLSTAFLAAHLVPWRFFALVAGWTATCAGHPQAQAALLDTHSLAQVRQHYDRLAGVLRAWIEQDIALDEPPEVREVEVFELQRRNAPSGLGIGSADEAAGPGVADGEWEPWLFSASPFDPMSPPRMAGARPVGTQFFEEVRAPTGWRWRDKKWSLDLGSRTWVEERCVTAVEIETEGERWVYDLGHGDLVDAAGKGKGKKVAAAVAAKSWEEGTGKGRKGEWRRRRWVRLVERKVVKVSSGD